MKIKTSKVLGLLLSLTLTSTAFASCYESYQEGLSTANDIIKNSNYKQASYESVAISSSSNLIVLSALAGIGGPSVSTIAGAGLVSAVFIAQRYIEFRTDSDAKEALEKRTLLNASLALLKEARVGNGPHLAKALTVINQNVSNAISMRDLSKTIVQQDDERLYCENDQIMSPSGMLSLAIDDLSLRF